MSQRTDPSTSSQASSSSTAVVEGPTPRMYRINSDTTAPGDSTSSRSNNTSTIPSRKSFPLHRRIARLLKPTSRRADPITLWDLFVFLSFFVCLIMFLRALGGIGYTEEEVIRLEMESRLRARESAAGLRSVHISGKRVTLDAEGYYSAALDHLDSFDTAAPVSTAAPSILDPGTGAVRPTLTSSSTSPVPSRLLVFGADEYDNEGRPFAMKIHLNGVAAESEASIAGVGVGRAYSKRCHGRSGGSC